MPYGKEGRRMGTGRPAAGSGSRRLRGGRPAAGGGLPGGCGR
ncbi:hypothetical protein [Desulfovirgula thermocuniculi]|nr:hypothetical protein [Desulfovirgula thermocuniculi]